MSPVRTIPNFSAVSTTAIASIEASFIEMLKKARTTDSTAYIDNTIHDEICIRCAPEKKAKVTPQGLSAEFIDLKRWETP